VLSLRNLLQAKFLQQTKIRSQKVHFVAYKFAASKVSCKQTKNLTQKVQFVAYNFSASKVSATNKTKQKTRYILSLRNLLQAKFPRSQNNFVWHDQYSV
jgi:hypothetical protein